MLAVFPRAILCQNVFHFSVLEQCKGRSSSVSFRPVAGRLGPKLGPTERPGLSTLGPAHDHIGLPSAAAGTDEPLAPIENAGVGAVASSHLCRVWLDLMLATLAPYDQADVGSGGVPQRHWRAGVRLHFTSGLIAAV
jgi:hypothetical protein